MKVIESVAFENSDNKDTYSLLVATIPSPPSLKKPASIVLLSLSILFPPHLLLLQHHPIYISVSIFMNLILLPPFCRNPLVKKASTYIYIYMPILHAVQCRRLLIKAASNLYLFVCITLRDSNRQPSSP